MNLADQADGDPGPDSIAHYDYPLATDLIAQTAVEPRDSARLLDVLGDRAMHRRMTDFAELLRPGDVIVVNDTKVLPARILLRKATGGAVEVLLLERAADGWWSALVKPSRKLPESTVIDAGPGLSVFFGPVLAGGRRRVELRGSADGGVLAGEDETRALENFGVAPLPPYITKATNDLDRYQTVYARNPGSVAAPTAGLHFTPELLERCVAAGAEIHRVELVVGLDTFRPVSVDRLDEHAMHSERYVVPSSTWAACLDTPRRGGRVVVVGTTGLRALESAAASGQLAGRTQIFIRPGFTFRVADVLLTNFHLPRSTLLVLLEAFAGPGWREWYRIAAEQHYRFLSFGDAMIVARARTKAV